MNLEDIRDELRTEDDKMEFLADYLGSGAGGVEIVEIHNMSGTLSDEDFAKVSKNNCVIVASTQYYYKQFSASTMYRFTSAPRLGVDKIIFDYITIDKETKAYELKNETYPAGE